MAGSPAGQPRWGARPVRLSAQREPETSLRPRLSALSCARGQDVRASILTIPSFATREVIMRAINHAINSPEQ
jgi:hypothetical protein